MTLCHVKNKGKNKSLSPSSSYGTGSDGGVGSNNNDVLRIAPIGVEASGAGNKGSNAVLERRKRQFMVEGLCVLPEALTASQTAAAHAAAIDYFEKVNYTINQLDLQEELISEGFTSFKLRHPGRYDMVVPAFNNNKNQSGKSTSGDGKNGKDWEGKD